MSLLLEDRALLMGFRRGDEEALTRVYDGYSDSVARYLASGVFLGRPGAMNVRPLDLEAAHQETFIRAFRPEARAGYDGLRPYGPYLLTIARSAAISLWRSNGKLAREWVSIEGVPELKSLVSDAPGPEEEAIHSEVREVVGAFLSRLAQGDRDLAQIRFVDGLSQEGAAAELQLTRAEVRTRESRLRKALTRFLSTNGWLEKGRLLR